MEVKYLWGDAIVLKEGAEDIRDNWEFEHSIAMTRRTDVYQHSDMARDVRLNVCYGGFARRFRKPDEITFFGESISCRVKTPEDITPLMNVHTGARYWKAEFGERGRKHAVFLLLDKAFVPSKGFNETNPWSETTHAEMREIIAAEQEANYGW